MGSTIFQAPAFDHRRERRKKILVFAVIAILVVGGLLAYVYRHVTYERLVTEFFTAVQEQDYEKAYGIWMADPDWKQHPEQHRRYPYHYFYQDWGPGGEWGLVRTFEIEGSTRPGSGVVVRVRVNGRADRANIWVETSDRTLTTSPFATIQ